jgi:hypothetical protein
MLEMPIRRVLLYKHGVGYFERETTVDGDADLTLTFRQREVSDVLKSLTVLDLDGGHIAAVSYDSTKPLAQLLADIAIDIPDRGSLVGFLPQCKGARVAVEVGTQALEGVIIGIDVVPTKTESGVTDAILLSLLLDDGEIVSVDLFEASLTLLDASLRRDLEFYLQTQFSAKKQENRRFTFFAKGQGQRRVRVSYVIEAPVWKATYRVLLGEDGQPPRIQGWAVVDNTQDEDWLDVELTLVAGLPVSFQHDLYTPRYIRRPVLQVSETTGILPPLLESGIEQTLDEDRYEAAASERVGARAVYEAPMAPAPMAPSMAGSPGTGRERKSRQGGSEASSVPTEVRERQLGDLFQYEIERPVTIRRNQSALVPIVLRAFEGGPVLVYSQSASAKNPLRCVEFRNTTGLTLEGGPVTVLEGGDYVGEAMLETTKPGDLRLIAYAVELSVQVLTNLDSFEQDQRRLVIRQGKLTHYSYAVSKTTYTIQSKSPQTQTLYLEHPRRDQRLKLVDTPEPVETTQSSWRFRTTLAANSTLRFVVTERRTLHQSVNLLDAQHMPITQLLTDEQRLSPDDRAKLSAILTAHQHVGQLIERGRQLRDELQAIEQEQKRIRENLGALGESASERELRERFVRTLTTQEDRLERLGAEQKRLNHELSAARAELDKLLQAFELELG